MLSATSTIVKFWSPVDVDQGIKNHNGLSIGYESSSIANTATTAQNGIITTQEAIACIGHMTAPSIYTKTEVDSLLTNRQTLWYSKIPHN